MTVVATPNYSRRTFTIRKTYEDGTVIKYRTIKMSQEEFEIEEMNTEKDWKHFLHNLENYTIINL
tara:strand:- start:281 stop:475 length:195 start_codon:yes stop_codon:yes gene_type:complete